MHQKSQCLFFSEKWVRKRKWLKRLAFLDCDSPKCKANYFVGFNVDGDDNEHIVCKTPLLKLGVGLVAQVSLDYMHLVCLGVVRMMVIAWCNDPLNIRLCSRDIESLTTQLNTIISHLPIEIQRKPRTLREMDR